MKQQLIVRYHQGTFDLLYQKIEGIYLPLLIRSQKKTLLSGELMALVANKSLT